MAAQRCLPCARSSADPEDARTPLIPARRPRRAPSTLLGRTFLTDSRARFARSSAGGPGPRDGAPRSGRFAPSAHPTPPQPAGRARRRAAPVISEPPFATIRVPSPVVELTVDVRPVVRHALVSPPAPHRQPSIRPSPSASRAPSASLPRWPLATRDSDSDDLLCSAIAAAPQSVPASHRKRAQVPERRP